MPVAASRPPDPAAGATADPGVDRLVQTVTAGGRRHAVVLALGLLVALAAVALAFLLSLSVGERAIPLGEVWRAIFGEGDPYVEIVVDTRWQRTLLGLTVGAALAVSGAIIQGITNNPLGDPGLLGINAGASTSVVIAMAITDNAGVRGVWVAFPGAVVAAVIVYVVGSGRRGTTPVRLALAGAAVTAILVALVQAIALTNPAVFDSYRFWVVGSLGGRTPDAFGRTWPVIAAALVVAVLISRSLNALALGDEAARAIGANTGRTRIAGALTATVLAAAATAAVGPIAFVGLVVPHLVRPITGPDHRWLIPYSAALGAALLLVSDVIGRVVVRPDQLMVGIVTALLGAPVLLFVVRFKAGGS